MEEVKKWKKYEGERKEKGERKERRKSDKKLLGSWNTEEGDEK